MEHPRLGVGLHSVDHQQAGAGQHRAGGRGRGGLVVGWLLGSLVWLVECTVSWVTGTMTDSYLPTQSMTVFDGLLLSPVIGGFFSAAVGLSSAALVSLTSRPRAQIR